jgi:hypothetical protein
MSLIAEISLLALFFTRLACDIVCEDAAPPCHPHPQGMLQDSSYHFCDWRRAD